MVDPVQLTSDERFLLLDHYRKAQATLIGHRAHAILLNADGHRPYEIATLLYRDEKTIREWVKAFHEQRLSSIFPGYRSNTHASKLTEAQREEIARILKKPPSKYDIPKEFWDVSALRMYVTAHFNVVYESTRSYHFLFRINHFSFKLPSTFDIRRKDRVVARRIKEIRREISPYLHDPNWVVLAGDETRVTWEAIIRRVWLPTGKKSILKVHRESKAQNFVGFLNLQTGKPHLFPVPWQNQKEIIKVLKLLLKKYPGKKICLVWDNAKFHKGKLIRKALEQSLSNYFLINFPPYAPDTNPQEHIWQWSKDQIGNIQLRTFKELIKAFRDIVMGRIYTYQI